jgi:hypothetical protein
MRFIGDTSEQHSGRRGPARKIEVRAQRALIRNRVNLGDKPQFFVRDTKGLLFQVDAGTHSRGRAMGLVDVRRSAHVAFGNQYPPVRLKLREHFQDLSVR